MRVVIDYLTMTSKIHNIDYFVHALGLETANFISMSGRYGWENRMYYLGCSLLYGGRDDICIELSGAGCRIVEELNPGFNWLGFFRNLETDIFTHDVHVSRLDIAGDEQEGLLYFRRLYGCCRRRRYICKSRYNLRMDGSEEQIYFGSPASDRRVRLYNKQMEQGIDVHWWRCEMQMRNKNATSFLLNWFRVGNVGEVYACVLRDYLRFTTAPVDCNHYDRAVTCAWWDTFIGGLGSCAQLYLAPPSYTMDRVRAFLERSCASTLKLFLQVHNGDMQDLIDIVDHAKLNSRQLQLLDRIEQGEAV